MISHHLFISGLDDKGKLAIDHYRMQGKNGKLTIDEEEYFNSLEEVVQACSLYNHITVYVDGFWCGKQYKGRVFRTL